MSELRTCLETLLVKDIAFGNKLCQRLGRPLTEMGGLFAVDTITDCNYGIKMVKICCVIFPICSSYSNFSNN